MISLKTLAAAIFLSLSFTGVPAMSQTAHTNPNLPAAIGDTWDKVFPRSDKVEHRKITFTNRYGITLVGDLYSPKGASGKLPAIAVSGPFGAVKEQSSGLYAQTLAERGFVTLAFDPSYTGESGGAPRNTASPDINTEDFSAAVDFLANQENIDADRIGILGVCGWGGMALNAAAADPRIKATATSTMYDMSRVNANGYNDSVDAEARYQTRLAIAKQRTEDFKNGSYAPSGNTLPNQLTGNEPQFVQEYQYYYKTPRGFHPRAINSSGDWNKTIHYAFANMPLLSYAGEIRHPVLIVAGEKAHSRYFSEDAFKKLTGDNKELYIVPDAVHTDLYDNTAGRLPFDKFADFFKANLK